MANDNEDQFNNQDPFNHLFKVGPIDLAQESNSAYPEDNEQDTLKAFSDLLHYDKKEEQLKTMGSSFGRQLDEAFKKNVEPIIPIDALSPEKGVGIVGSTIAPILEENKQKFFLEKTFSPSFQSGVASYIQSVGEAFKFHNVPGHENLLNYANELIRNTKAREEPSIVGVYENSKDVKDAAKKFWNYLEEATGVGLGSASVPLGAALGTSILLGKKILGIPLIVANLPAGEGQAIQALKEEQDRMTDIAYEAEANGNTLVAKAYRDLAEKIKPENNTKIIYTVGALITALDSASDFVTIFNGAPKHLVDEVKKGLYSKIITNLARKSAIGLTTEGGAEVMQDFIADLGVLKAKGLTEWLDAYRVAKEKNYYIESFAGGAVPGAVLGGGSAAVQQAGSILTTQGTTPSRETTLPEVTVTQGMPTAAYGEDNQITELSPEFKTSLQDYLANPENTFRKKDYKKIAKTFGISEDAVPEHLEAAAQEGLIRKDPNGIYRKPITAPQNIVQGDTKEQINSVPVMPESSITKEQAVEEYTSQQSQVVIPEDLDQQYTTLETQITTDTERLNTLRTELKNASSKKRLGMNAERTERDSLVKNISQNKKKLEGFDDLKKEREKRANQPKPKLVRAKASAKRSFPETGQTLLNYLKRQGGITAPGSYVGDTRSIYAKAQSLFGKDIPVALIRPNGKNLDDTALWDDLVEQEYIPPYLDPNGGANLYDPREKITDLIAEEIGGRKVYSGKYQGKPIDRKQEETDVLRAAKEYYEVNDLGYNLSPQGEARLVELVLDEGLTIDAAIERLAIEEAYDAYDGSSENIAQSSGSPQSTAEGQEPGSQGQNQEERGYFTSTSEEGSGTGEANRSEADVIPFSVFAEEKFQEATYTAKQVEKALKQALEQFKKIAPQSTNIKVFDETLNNLSSRLYSYINKAESTGAKVEAAYDPVEDLIILSQYGSNPTALVSHEAVHALKRNGLITGGQIKKLAEDSRKLGLISNEDIAQYRRVYSNANRAITATRLNEILDEEAAARLVQAYSDKKTQAPKLQKILDKIVEFLRIIRRAFGGKLTTNDIVDMILNGDAAKGKLGKYVTQNDLTEASKIITASIAEKNADIVGIIQAKEKEIANKPQEILAAIGKSSSGQDVKGISNIIRELAKGLGITLKQGGGPAWGYQPVSGVIRNKAYYDFTNFTQSLAPYLEAKFSWVVPLQMQHSTELGPLDAQALDPAEGFRIWMELYLTDRTLAQEKAPTFTQEFEDALEVANPNYLAQLQAAQLAYEAFTTADPITAVESSVTPAERTTMFSKMSKDFKEAGVYSTIKHYLLTMYANTVAKEAPLTSAVRKLLYMELEKTGNKRWLKVIENPAKLFLMVPQAQQMGTMNIKNGIQLRNGRISGPGMPEVLRKALGDDRAEALDLNPGSRYSHFLTYLVALRGKQLWERHMAGEMERPPLAISYQVATRAIQDLEAKYPDFAEAQRMLNQFTRALLRLKYEAGLIDTKTFNELNRDRFYVPFQRSFDEEVSVAFKTGQGKNVDVRYLLKKIKGSKRDVIDPIAIICKDVYSTANLIAINDTVKSLVKLAEEVGPESGSIVERVSAKETVADLVHIEQVLRTSAKDAGLSQLDTANLIQQVAGTLGTDALGTAFKQVSIRPGSEPIIPFMENGKLQALRLNDPQLAKLIFDSMSYVGKEWTGLIANVLTAPAQLVRSTVTTNPSFLLANVIRDALHAFGYEYGMVPVLAQMQGMKLYANKAFREKYIRSGGIMGGIGAHGMDQRRMDDGIKKLVNLGYNVKRYSSVSDWWRAVQTSLELTETFSRIKLYEVAYKRALKQGLSEVEAEREAAFHANAYCDYSRHGIRTGVIRKLVAFMNASVQGLDRFVRVTTGAGDYGSVFNQYFKYKFGNGARLTPAEQQQLKQSFVAYSYYIMVIGGISALVYAYNDDDDRLRDVPDEIKRTHWVIPMGDVVHLVEKGFPSVGEYLRSKGADNALLRIPKPFESAFIANLFERFLWEKKNDDPNWFLKWADDIFGTALPPMRPAFIDYTMIFYGKDPYTWKDIEPSSLKQLEPSERFTPYTSEFAKTIGEKLNISPVKVDASLKALGTSWARDLLALNIPGLTWYNENKPELGLDEFMFARRFLWRVGKGSEAGKIVREMMGEEDPTKGVIRRLGVPYSALNMKSKTYQEKFKKASLDDANKYLSTMTKREQGFAILMAGSEGRSDAKFEKLDPINRASIIGKASFNLQREIASGTLTQDKGKKKEARVPINSQSKLQATEILLQIQGQESHNALVLTQEPGYAKRVMFDTQGLYDELKEADPEIHKEFMRRLKSENVVSWEGTKAIWPELKSILESDVVLQEAQRGNPKAVDREIRAKGLYFRAKYPTNDGERLEAQ